MASYEGAMEAAGATVHTFEQFGSYQGEWFAKVTYNDITGWVSGSFGSCSGCDSKPNSMTTNRKTPSRRGGVPGGEAKARAERREQYGAAVVAFKERYADFGRGYLDNILTQEQAEEQASKNLEWDSQAQGMLDYLVAQRA